MWASWNDNKQRPRSVQHFSLTHIVGSALKIYFTFPRDISYFLSITLAIANIYDNIEV